MADIGHNSVLTDKEADALFGHHLRRRVAIHRKREELKAEEAKCKADSKNDGIPEAEIKDYLDCFFATDKQKKVDKFKLNQRTLIRLGLISEASQKDLLADRATNDQKIYAAGYAAGLCAADRVSNYDAGSADDRMFLDGYDDAQAVVRDNFQAAMEKRLAARTKEEPPAEVADGQDPFSVH